MGVVIQSNKSRYRIYIHDLKDKTARSITVRESPKMIRNGVTLDHIKQLIIQSIELIDGDSKDSEAFMKLVTPYMLEGFRKGDKEELFLDRLEDKYKKMALAQEEK